MGTLVKAKPNKSMDWAMVTYKAQHMPTRPKLLHSLGYCDLSPDS